LLASLEQWLRFGLSLQTARKTVIVNPFTTTTAALLSQLWCFDIDNARGRSVPRLEHLIMTALIVRLG
jgi:hypothetical protein